MTSTETSLAIDAWRALLGKNNVVTDPEQLRVVEQATFDPYVLDGASEQVGGRHAPF